jgi:predicted kinase
MAKMIVLVGNIGSGKSFYSKKLVKEGYRIVSRDSLRSMINAGDYVFDRDKEPIVHEMTVRCVYALLSQFENIVIDETNVSKKMRSKYIEMAKKWDYELEAHVLPMISKEESIQRRMNDNHGDNSKETWEEVWDRFDNRYCEPTIEEGFDEVVKL